MTDLLTPTHTTEQAEAVLQVFETAAHPITVKEAEKEYSGPKLKKDELRQLVEGQLLMKGQLFRCSPAGKNPRYWVHDEEEKVRETVVELLASEPLAESKLATAVNKALPKVSSTAAIKNYIHSLRQSGQLHERPGKGKTMLLSLQPYDPLEAITLTKATINSLYGVLAKVQALGGGMEQLLQIIRRQLQPVAQQAPTPPQDPTTSRPPRGEGADGHSTTISVRLEGEIEQLILKGMHDLNSAVDQGATVLLRDLRRHMPAIYRSHETFDPTVIRLAEQERIVLHRHDQPSFLTDAERDELVRDENGTYFTALAQRV
jgi:hypothetical protein